MSELEQTNNALPAVSFATDGPKLTYGQTLIIKFLKEKMERKESVTREDITRVYIHAKFTVKNNTISLRCTYKGRYNFHTNVPIDAVISRFKYDSFPWFKNNLGSCIIKGKLIAIPVIEI